MKRLKYLFLVAGVFGTLCCLTAFKKDILTQPTFPLEEDVITDTLDKTGLEGIISQSETTSYREGQILHVVRSETETYADSDNKVLVASINSAVYEGERVLFTSFDQKDVSDQIEWEDWKKQIVFATLLYGGFEDEEDVYQAFLDKEIPYGENPYEVYENPFQWETQLPGGYCTVSYSSRSNTTYDEKNFPVEAQSAIMSVNIYASKELYEKLAQLPAQSEPAQKNDKGVNTTTIQP